jgi:hypothetical protein
LTARALPILVFAGLLAPAASPQLSPTALYQALLQGPVEASSLPAGYGSPRVAVGTPSTRAKSHHVVGEVDMLASKRGTAGARVLYIVFPNSADALADWKDGLRHSPKTRLSPPSSVAQPAAMFNLAATGTTKIGATILGCLRGNLIVEVETSSTSSAAHGDIQGAAALARFALTHLHSLGQRA